MTDLAYSGYMIASDLDGTLIKSDFSIPGNNITAVNKFMSQGGTFAIATGRSIESARQYAAGINPNSPCVVLNGVVIYDFIKDNVLWDTILPLQAKEYLKDIKEKFPLLGMEVFADNHLHLITPNHQTEKHVKNESIDYIDSSLDEVNGRWYKALFAGTANEINEIAAYCSEIVYPGVRFVRSSPIYFEMLPENSNKGAALKILADMMGIPIKNIFAIGDYYNDCEMLEIAGTGVAVGNAPDELKDKADLVVCNCNEGAIDDLVGYISKTIMPV